VGVVFGILRPGFRLRFLFTPPVVIPSKMYSSGKKRLKSSHEFAGQLYKEFEWSNFPKSQWPLIPRAFKRLILPIAVSIS
jgi:hypothetical protein